MFEGIVSSTIVTLLSDIMSVFSLTVDVDKFVGRVAGGDSLVWRPGSSAYNLEQRRISSLI